MNDSMPSILDREILRKEPFVGVKGGNRLFGGCNQIFIVLCVPVHYLVQLLVELFELCSLGHVILQHKLRSLQGSVTPGGQKFEAIVDQSLVKENTPILQKITAMPDHFHPALGIVSV